MTTPEEGKWPLRTSLLNYIAINYAAPFNMQCWLNKNIFNHCQEQGLHVKMNSIKKCM